MSVACRPWNRVAFPHHIDAFLHVPACVGCHYHSTAVNFFAGSTPRAWFARDGFVVRVFVWHAKGHICVPLRTLLLEAEDLLHSDYSHSITSLPFRALYAFSSADFPWFLNYWVCCAASRIACQHS
jgi:hypothetical protein